MCVCIYSVSVLCYCPLRQLFNSPLYPRTRAETQHSGEKLFPQPPKRREAKKKQPDKHASHMRISVLCVRIADFSEVRGSAFNHVYYYYNI